jgi:hypothetical protein
MSNAADEGQWVTTFTAGTSLIPHGTFQEGALGELPDLGAIDAPLAGEPGKVAIDHLSFHDAFRLGPQFGIETGYVTDSNLEPFMRLSYSQLRGRTARIGTMTAPALASPAAISADFGDADSWALNVGARYFLTDATAAVRPFVSGFVGADRTDALHAHFAVKDLEADLGREVLLPRETRFDAGIEGGVSFQLANQAELSFSVGADYVNARQTQSAAFAPLGVDSVTLTDQRWSIPIDVGLSYRF